MNYMVNKNRQHLMRVLNVCDGRNTTMITAIRSRLHRSLNGLLITCNYSYISLSREKVGGMRACGGAITYDYITSRSGITTSTGIDDVTEKKKRYLEKIDK